MKQKMTGRASSIPKGLGWGLMASLSIILMGTGITTVLIDSEILSWNNAGYAILICLIISAWMGAILSCHKIKRQKALVCGLSGATLFATLMVLTALLFGGQYSGVGETALLIVCGSVLALLTGNRGKRGRKRIAPIYHR